MDLTKLSDDDLRALAGGDVTKLSDDGLRHLSAQSVSGEQEGRQLPTIAKSALNILQGPTFGFGDEIIGAIGGAKSAIEGKGFRPGYERTRDTVRGAVKSLQAEYPVSSAIGNISGGLLMAPTIPVKTALGAAGVGAGYGALSGAGEAPTMAEVPGNVLKGAAIGGVSSGVVGGAGPVVNTILGPVRKKSATDIARQRIAEAMQRDGYDVATVSRAINELPDEAVLADATGENALNLLKSVVQQPGKAARSAKDLIEARQSSRGSRLIDAAEKGLSPTGARLPDTIASLRDQQLKVAGPLYQKVENSTVPATPEISDLLSRAKLAFGEAKKIAEIEGKTFDIPEIVASGGNIPLKQLDTIKRSLFDLEEATRSPANGRLNETGRAIQSLRRDLVAKIDQHLPDYKAARNAFAGPAEMTTAAELGNKSINSDAWKIKDLTEGMNPSELEAFKIGAFEALRKKLGTQAGQANILNMWREGTTRERLTEIFGDFKSFNEFAKKVGQERQMRELEKVRGGSDTFQKIMQAQDTGEKTAADVATGGLSAAARKLPSLWQSMKTPEAVRDEIGRILLSGKAERQLPGLIGPVQPRNEAGAELGAISRLISNQQKNRKAAGKIGGLLAP